MVPFTSGQPRGATAFRAGAAEAVITPTQTCILLGPLERSTGVHDDLYARALVLDDGAQRLALVTLDLIGLDIPFASAIRDQVRRRTGVAEALINCSHTHSAPFTIPWGYAEWREFQHDGEAWRSCVLEAVVDVVDRAVANEKAASLLAGCAPVQVGANRRLPTDRGVLMEPNPDGPAVPWVDVLRVDGADSSPIAILFSHAAHPVIVHGASTLISADYPGYAVAGVRTAIGDGVIAMFAQGCGANVNGEPLRGGFAAAEEAGQRLTEAVLAAYHASEPVAFGRMEISRAPFMAEFQDLPALEECEESLRAAVGRLSDPEAGWYDWNNVRCLQDLTDMVRRGEQPTLPFEICAVRIGMDFCLLTTTHECFCDYQLWTEEQSPFAHTMVWGYTNGCESYVPTDQDLSAGSGYEAIPSPELPPPGDPAAGLCYRNRLALKPGIEDQLKAAIRRAMGIGAI